MIENHSQSNFRTTVQMFWAASHNQLEKNDLKKMRFNCKCPQFTEKLERSWDNQASRMSSVNWKLGAIGPKEKESQNEWTNVTYWASSSGLEFFRAILHASWCPIFLTGIGQFVDLVILRTLLPFLQILLIQHFSNSKELQLLKMNEFSQLIQCFILVILLALFINRCTSIASGYTGIKITSACASLLQKKSLKLNFSVLGRRTIKEIATIFENELENFDGVVVDFNNLWIIPIQIITVWTIMTFNFGFISVLPILTFLCVFASLLSLLQYSATILQKTVLEFTEKRVEVLIELISAIRIVKLWSWETPFEKVVSMTRLMEMEMVRKILHILSLSNGFIDLTDKLVILVFVTLNLIFEIKFDGKFIFTVFLYSLVLKNSVMNIFPGSVRKISVALHSCKKIQDFLLLDEIKEFPNGGYHSNFFSMEFKKTSAALIRNLSLTINHGDLCVVMGAQNSGKSSLIRLILQEIPTRSGNFSIHDSEKNSKPFFFSNLRISYASQQPWIFSGSIRENIVFQEEFDNEKYFQVLRSCALTRDISQFLEGDKTLVGKHGRALTVEQATKIDLARAVYKNADLYLFDDPLGPLEASTRRYIFEKSIKELLFDKTRVLTSRPVQIFSPVNSIVYLNSEETIVGRKYQDLVRKSSKFASLMKNLEVGEGEKNDHDSFDLYPIPMTLEIENEVIQPRQDENKKSETSKDVNSSNRVLKRNFFQSGLLMMSILVLLTFIFSQVMITVMECSLGYWLDEEQIMFLKNANNSPDNFGKRKNLSFFSVRIVDKFSTSTSAMDFYIILVAASIVLISLRTFIFTELTMKASKTLHDFSFKMILQTQLKFFNSSSAEMITKLFGNNLVQIDQELPQLLLGIVQKIFLFISILFISIFINPWTIIPAVFATSAFSFTLNLYTYVSRTTRTLTFQMKTELIDRVDETLDGLLTIRSGGKSSIEKFYNNLERYHESYTAARNFGLLTFSIYHICLDCITGIFITSVCCFLIFLDDDNFFGGTVALALTQTTMLMDLIHPFALETIQFTERLDNLKKISFFENLPREKSEGHHPSPSWPSRGRITIKDVSVKRQDHDQPFIQNFNMVFEHGWKVGVVDESGIGKNVLIDLLFRLNIDDFSGEVKIDGRNIKSVNLSDLRSRISIVPRDPVFFKETLRYNMNPFGLYTDQLLSEALRAVGLRGISLDSVMVEGGQNLTLGQRQLVCLAIAIIKDNRILLIEEAPSDIDLLANSLIQKTLRTKFTTHTVITLAHCISSVIDNDRIMMMEKGTLLEFGCPHELLCDKSGGHFAALVRRVGGQKADELLRRAEIACRQNKNEYSLELASSSSSSPRCSFS